MTTQETIKAIQNKLNQNKAFLKDIPKDSFVDELATSRRSFKNVKILKITNSYVEFCYYFYDELKFIIVSADEIMYYFIKKVQNI